MSKGYNRDDMDDREFVKILASAEQLRLRGNETEPWADCYSDMNFIEKSMLLDELFALRKADIEREAVLLEKLDRMANVSAAYHTLISTCRAYGISTLVYLKKFFRELVEGHRDYENLLSMTIGINTNKHSKSSLDF